MESLLTYLPPTDPGVLPEPDDLYEAFAYWAAETGRSLYPHQEEALLEVMTGASVVVTTPTGSGKSLIALGAHFAALAAYRNQVGGRTFYTAPLKALVSEKFFDLIDAFGAENVGMMTGDSAVNADAPIICCTAEILANMALRRGNPTVGTANPHPEISQVVMDEFHFYGDPERGWAWQIPLLELPQAQFVLMSATLGNTDHLRADIANRTARDIAEVTSAERPVPLEFEYLVDPLPDTLERLVREGKAPVYVVNFTQREAVEQAQALLSLPLTTKAEKERIAAEISDFKFGTGFGKVLSRFVRAGVGVHHAGMLPKYRRLVERLTQRGLLKVVCGTDTLGVGINMPIRTVLFTALTKYDGERDRQLTAREFHQIAGRAGRAGFDTLGEVIVLAPEHVIANRTALLKAGDDPKKLKKITRKKAPPGQVNWTEQTFDRLRDAEPEALTSQFRVTHAMLLNLLARSRAAGDPAELDVVAALGRLLAENHDTPAQKREHLRQAFRVYRSLRRADVVERVREPDITRPNGYRPTFRLKHDIPEDFALNQTLSPFALAAMDLVDPTSPTHALDVVSVIESTLENPRQVLIAQEKSARGKAIAEMKADGLEYDERMVLLEDVTYAQPLAEVLEPAFTMYVRTNPWVAGEELKPKSVVREFLETADTFTDYVNRYGLERSEGVLLRYLADAFRALRQVVPAEHRTPEVAEIVEWLGELVRGIDSSLLDEWEQLGQADGSVPHSPVSVNTPGTRLGSGITANPLAFRRLVRNAMFRLVDLSAREDYDALGTIPWLGDDPETTNAIRADRWADALDPLFVAQGDDAIGIDGAARSPALLTIVEPGGELPAGILTASEASLLNDDGELKSGYWWVRQVIDDAEGHHDYAITAVVDLTASESEEKPALRIVSVGAA
ncbi:MAG: DUF3516 domain-containing protein [Promicromonosporaceae bacterium]|nr:DUF3516 domain-containing protein [Promicromonosporaceae bacterium]